MTDLIYKPFNDLEQLATHAASLIETGQRYLNFFVLAELEVSDILNKVIGGCETVYTPTQLNEVATSINENFDNGNLNNGFLCCQ